MLRNKRWAVASGACALLVGLGYFYFHITKSDGFSICHRSVITAERVVALTFDDGPCIPTTLELLKVLKKHDVKATFFMLGKNISAHPEIAKAVVLEGHEAGNHSFSHVFLISHPMDFVRTEIETTDRLLREAGVKGEPLFRPPYGSQLRLMPWELWLIGIKREIILFDVVGQDWDGSSAEAVAQRVRDRAKPGSIVVLHDGGGDRSATVTATAMIIPLLKERGYRFVTVSELLACGKN